MTNTRIPMMAQTINRVRSEVMNERKATVIGYVGSRLVSPYTINSPENGIKTNNQNSLVRISLVNPEALLSSKGLRVTTIPPNNSGTKKNKTTPVMYKSISKLIQHLG